MADREQLYQALRNADKAGDTAGARRLAEYIKSLPPADAPDNGGIPVSAEERAYGARNAPVAQPAAPADPSLVDKVKGLGETALSLASGATTGTLGMIGGTAKGLAQSVADGTFGTQQGVRNVEQAAAQGADALTYAPRTATGQQYTQAAGDAVNAALPVMPLTAEVNALGRGAATAGGALRDLAANTNAGANAADAALAAAPKAKLRDTIRAPKFATAEDAAKAQSIARIRTTNPQLADLVEKVNPPAVVAEADMPGVGAAKTGDEAIRAQRFAEMGINPTQGMLDRTFEQQQFEREAAKSPEGKALNDRFADTNQQMDRYIEGLADSTGASAGDLIDTGNSVLNAVEAKKLVKQADYKNKYDIAEANGEMQEPVDVTNLLNFVKSNAAKSKVAPIISVIGAELKKNAQEVGGRLDPLTLTPTPKRLVMPLNATESLRQAINDMYDPGTPNAVFGKQAKRVLDVATEDKGGPLYRDARKSYEDYANEFVNRDVIDKMLRMKPGTKDRSIPIEKIFHHAILNGSLDDVNHVFRVLEKHPEGTPTEIIDAGHQAANDLRGALVNHIKEQMFSNSGADIRGNVVGSEAKIGRIITKLDSNRKLEAVLGKELARKMRDVRAAAVDLYTSPKGSVNHANTASSLVARLDKIQGMIGGTPLVGHAAKYAAKKAASRDMAKKVEAALNPPMARKF